jgi:hypothetical protein
VLKESVMFFKRPAAKPKTTASKSSAPAFGGVSIVSGDYCCPAAKSLQGHRLLTDKAPKLPLADCTGQSQCKCHYKKYSDRRDAEDERRFYENAGQGAWYSSEERRNNSGRRRGD